MIKDYVSRLCGVSIIGGQGKRLRPFTNNKPKSLLPVGIERKPMLEFTIMPWIKVGIKKFVFCTGYRSEMIGNYFGDGSKLNVHIDYSKEEDNLETGGAIKNAMYNKKLSKDNPIIIFYCDDFVRLDAKDFINTHLKAVKEYEFKATIIATNRFRTHYGIIEVETTDGIKRVVDFKEKPLIDKHANVGICCLEPEVLSLIEKEIPPFKFERVILPKLVEKGWLTVYEIPWEDWIPVNTDTEYEQILKTDLTDFYFR